MIIVISCHTTVMYEVSFQTKFMATQFDRHFDRSNSTLLMFLRSVNLFQHNYNFVNKFPRKVLPTKYSERMQRNRSDLILYHRQTTSSTPTKYIFNYGQMKFSHKIKEIHKRATLNALEFHQKLIIQTMKLNWTKLICDCSRSRNVQTNQSLNAQPEQFKQAFNVFCVIYLETHCLPQIHDGKLHVKRKKAYRSFMIIRQLFKLIAICSQLTGIRFVSKVSRCLKLIALFNSMKRKKINSNK